MNINEALLYMADAAARKPAPESRRQRSQKFYASPAWRRLRFKVLAANAERHGGSPCCELCGQGRRDGEIMHVDHIEPLSKNWERRLDVTNLQALCASCNMGKMARSTTDFRPAPPESAGDAPDTAAPASPTAE